MLVPLYLLLSILHRSQSADLTYSVEEGRGPGVYVGNIAADSHLLDNIPIHERSLITFSLLQTRQANGSPLFHVSEKTGKLYTVHTLDTESMCKRYKECYKMVEVAVQKGTSFIKVLEIKIILKDINDHRPEFNVKQVDIQISEDVVPGTKISIPNAIDKDVGSHNHQVRYKLDKRINDPFSLSVSKRVDGTSQLFINLEEKLDREVKNSYMIRVTAKDAGSPPKQSVLNVNITVMDVNDNLPIFSQKVYNVTIKNEPSDTIPVLILSASDLDIGKNGRVMYEFSSQTSHIARVHFTLNKLNGEIFLHKKFTLGQEMTYKLYVEATDGGSPSLSSIAMVLVNVINQKNNAPSIDVNFVTTLTGNTIAIPESTEVGSFIAYVKVTDHDPGQNGEVSCVLHHDKFQLQSLGTKKYKVVVKNPVDREAGDQHNITIVCQDKGTPPLHREIKFSIQVLDVNDVQPKFTKKMFKFWIYENEKPNFRVGYIRATDPDLGAGGKLSYALLNSNNLFLPFQISDNGLISTVMSLDHEFQDIYKFKVLVKDNGRISLNNTVDVVIEVRDENDNAPYFTFPSVNPYIMDIVYYPGHTKNITVLRASDNDGRENGFLKFQLIRGNDNQLFMMNHYSGLLSFTRAVAQDDAGSYELEFAVKDSGTPALSSTTTLILILTVSNKTFELINAVNIETDETNEEIYLDFLIVIVSVAVTLSVIITAVISVCFLRISNRKSARLKKDSDCSSIKCKQRQLMYPAILAGSCVDIPSTRIEELDTTRDVHFAEIGRDLHAGDDLDLECTGSASVMHVQAASEVIYQEIGGISGGRKCKRTALIVPNSHKEVSMLSWNGTNSSHHRQVSDQYSSHYSLAHSPWTDFNALMKPITQRFSSPGQSRMSPPSSLYKPNVQEVTEWTGFKGSQPWTLPETRRMNPNYPQLPTTTQIDSQAHVDPLVQLPIPKYYVLEPNPGDSTQKFGSVSSTELEHSLQLPLPKYYVLESNFEAMSSSSPTSSIQSQNNSNLEDRVPLPIPKYYVLERNSQNRPHIINTKASNRSV